MMQAFPVCQVSLRIAFSSLVFCISKAASTHLFFLTELQNTIFYAIALRPLFPIWSAFRLIRRPCVPYSRSRSILPCSIPHTITRCSVPCLSSLAPRGIWLSCLLLYKSCQHTSFVFSLHCQIQSSTLLHCVPYSSQHVGYSITMRYRIHFQ